MFTGVCRPQVKKLQAMLRQAHEQLETTARERQQLEAALSRSAHDAGHQVRGLMAPCGLGQWLWTPALVSRPRPRVCLCPGSQAPCPSFL